MGGAEGHCSIHCSTGIGQRCSCRTEYRTDSTVLGMTSIRRVAACTGILVLLEPAVGDVNLVPDRCSCGDSQPIDQILRTVRYG